MTDAWTHLFFCIACEYAEYDRWISGTSEVHDTTSCLSADIVKVRCITADDDSECEKEIIVISIEKPLGESWYFEGSRHKKRSDIMESLFLEKLSIVLFELTRIREIEFRDDERDADISIERIYISEFCSIIWHKKL